MSEEIKEQQEPEVIGPGQLLKQAREKAGLSVAEIAEKLRLKVMNIEDLEADKYDEAISLTFTRGYLKLYARQVNLSEQVVLEAFDKHNTKSKEPAKLQSFSRRVAKQASDDRLMLVTYFIVFAVIALVVVWWWQKSSSDSAAKAPAFQENKAPTNTVSKIEAPETVVAAEQEIMAPEAEDITPQVQTEMPSTDPVQDETAGTEALEDNLVQAPESDTAQVLVDDLVPEQESDEQTQVPDNDVEPAQISEPDFSDVPPVELVFQFSGDCWMNLEDATGEAIAYGVKASGRIMPVSGVPPFEVTLGAPESVQISYDGVAVDMTRFRAGQTARFTLPFSE